MQEILFSIPPVKKPMIYVVPLSQDDIERPPGMWIDATQPAVTIEAIISEMCAESSDDYHRKWAIVDYKEFGPLVLARDESIKHVARVAQLIAEYTCFFAGLLSRLGGTKNVEKVFRMFKDGYMSSFNGDFEEFLKLHIEDRYRNVLNTLPSSLRRHIDYSGLADELELSGELFAFSVNGVQCYFANLT